MDTVFTETSIEQAATSRYPDEPFGVMDSTQRSDTSYAFESGAHWALESARDRLLAQAAALSAPKGDDEGQTAFAMRMVRAEHIRQTADLIVIAEG